MKKLIWKCTPTSGMELMNAVVENPEMMGVKSKPEMLRKVMKMKVSTSKTN